MSTNRTILRFLRYAHALLGTTLAALMLFIVLNTFVVTVFRVDGQSMAPTLNDQQFLGVSIASYTFEEPIKNDVVVLHYAGDAKVKFVKRITGQPGDMVDVGGQLKKLGSDEFYVVGDNQDHSTDSRVFGPIKRDQIIGKVIVY